MANNLHFEYRLSVDEKATKNSLDSFIKKTFGDGRNTKLSVPIKLDIANSISDIDFDKVQKEIDKKVKNGLKVKAKVNIDLANIKNQVQAKIAEIDKDLSFKVGLEIDPSAVKTMSGTIDVMQTLNKEIDKIKNNMKELGKNLTINVGSIEVKGQYNDLLKTSEKINDENKKTEESLQEQLRTQKELLQTKEKEMKQLKEEIESERERLETAKARKATNDELIQQEKDLRKEASKIDEQIKAEQEKQKLYETQNTSLKEQAKTQQQLADDLKKTNEEISKLETDKTASETRLQVAKEEEQRRLNNIGLMKEENQLLRQKIAELEKMASVADGATSGEAKNSRKSISLKALSNKTAEQTEEVAKKRIEQEQEVTSIMEKQSQQQRESIEKQIKAEGDLAKAELKTVKVVKATAKDVLYNRVQSSEIAKAIHNERVEGVRTLEEEMAQVKRLGKMVEDERGLLSQVNELLSQRGNITEENTAKAKELSTALKDELTLIQEAAGVRPSADKDKFKDALKKYNANPTPETLATLEFQAEKLGKIGGLYEYMKRIKKELKKLEKAYNVEAERSLEIAQKQAEIDTKRSERATNMKTKEIYNKESKKEHKYKDAGSYVTEEMLGFSATQLADALGEYDKVLEKYYAKDSFDVDYRKTDKAIENGTKKIARYTEAMKEATDEAQINRYAKAIEGLNAKILDLKKSVNTYQEISTMLKAKEEGTYDFGAQTTSSSNKSSDDDKVVVYEGKVKQLKELTEQFIRYALGMQTVQNQAVDLKIKFGWLTKEFDNLIAKKSVDEDSWTKLASEIEEFRTSIGVTTEEVEEYIASIKNKMNVEQQQAQQAKEQREQEIAKGNELKATLQEQMKSLNQKTKGYKMCKDALNDYSKAVKHNLDLSERIKKMSGLVNFINNRNQTSTGEEGSDKDVKKTTTAIQSQTRERKANRDEIVQGILALRKEKDEANKASTAMDKVAESVDTLSESLRKMANMASFTEEETKDLVKHIQTLVAEGKNLTKAEMNKMSKSFQSEELKEMLDRRDGITAQGRTSTDGVRFNTTEEYKKMKSNIDALVNNATDNLFDLFKKMYEEAKKVKDIAQDTVQVTSKAKDDTLYIKYESANGEWANPNNVVPDSVIALMEARMGTYNKKGIGTTPSYRNSIFLQEDENPRVDLIKEMMMYHKDFAKLNALMDEIVQQASKLKDTTKSKNFKKLQNEFDKLEGTIYNDISAIVGRLGSSEAKPFYGGEHANKGDLMKVYSKRENWELDPNDLIQQEATALKATLETNKQKLSDTIKTNKEILANERETKKQMKKEEEKARREFAESYEGRRKEIEDDEFGFFEIGGKTKEDAIRELDKEFGRGEYAKDNEKILEQLRQELAEKERLMAMEEDMLQNAKDDISIEESKNAKIEERLANAKKVKVEQEEQLASSKKANSLSEEENRLKAEAWERINKTITSLQEEKRLKEQMANDVKNQIMQEELLGSTSDKSLKRMKEHYEQLRTEAKTANDAIDAITKAIENQEKAQAKANTTSYGVVPGTSTGGNQSTGSTSGGSSTSNTRGYESRAKQEAFITDELSEHIKLRQRELTLQLQNLVYGKDLTDNQKLMVNELMNQIVALGKGVSSMRELNLESKKIKQNMNETKFDVKVTTTGDKDAKKQLEEQRKARESMYRDMFDELEKQEKKVREMENMYAKMFDQIERGEKAEERSKVILEDKVKKQRELWELKIKEFEKTELGSHANQDEIQALKDMASDIGKNVANMRELNEELHNVNVKYREMKQVAKDNKQTEAINRETEALRELIAYKEEELRQMHQNTTTKKYYREATDEQREAYDRLGEQLKLTGSTTEEVNKQYSKMSQQIKGMRLDMVTEQLGRQETAFQKVVGAMKQYVVMNLDILDCFNYLQRGFSNAFEHVKVLDEAYTNISMTMDVTQKKFQTMIDTAYEVGNANGQLATEVLNMMKVYANAGTTVEEINSQMKATVAFQNVTGMDATSVTNSIQTILQQYKLLEDGTMSAAQATEYLGDVMVGVSYNLAKEESDAMREVIEGIETAGGMMQTSGGSFEWFASVVGTLAEVMNASGSETANAMKMIAARTLKSKEAIEELAESGENMEDIEIAASNAELALNSIGLTARTQTGDMKELEVIMGEVAGKWDTLTNATKQYVSEQLAGNNRRNYFIGMMDNYKRVEELAKTAKNSTGALMEASDKQAKSLEGRLNTLQNAWTRLYEAMINSGTAKGAVSGLTGAVNLLAKGMENLHIILPAVVTSVIAFKSAMYGASVGEFAGHIIDLGRKHLVSLYQKLLTATGAVNGLALAMTALKAVGIGVFVGGLVWAVSKYIQKVQEAKITTEDLEDGITNVTAIYERLVESLDNADKAMVNVQSLEEANKELQKLEEGTKEYSSKQDEINSKLKELSSMYPDIAVYLQSELIPMEEKLRLLDQQIEKEKELAKTKAHDDYYNNKTDISGLSGEALKSLREAEKAKARYQRDENGEWFIDGEKELKKYEEAIEKATTAYETALANMQVARNAHSIGALSDEELAKEEAKLQAMEERIKGFSFGMDVINGAVKGTNETLDETVEHVDNLTPKLQKLFMNEDFDPNDFGKTMDSINKILANTEISAEDAARGLEVLKEQFPELVGEAETFGEAISNLNTKSLNETYAEQISLLEEAQSLMNSINEEGLNAANISTLQGSELMKDFTGSITDAVSVTDHLKNKFQELQDAQYETCVAMALNNENTWNEMTNQMAESLGIQNSEFAKSLGIQEGEFANYVNSLGGMRQVDIQNAVDSADAQRQAELDLCRQGIYYYSSFINEKAGNRKTDMANVTEFLNTQGAKEAQTIEQLKQAWATYYNAKAKAVSREYLDLKASIKDMDAGQVDPAIMKQINSLNAQLQSLHTTNMNMKNYFENVSTSISGVSNDLNQTLTNGNKIVGNTISNAGSGSSSRPSSSSSSKPSSGSSSSIEKTVDDLQLEIDRYYALNDAIENVNKALAKNRALQENVTTKEEYKKLINEELSLLAQKQKALENLRKEQEKERDEMKKSLQSNGFTFDSNNNITNYAKRLQELQNWANKFTNPEQKESAIAQVKAIKDMIDKYTTLEDSTIPSTTDEINNLKNEITSINKEFEENMKLIDALGDRYFDLLRKVAKLDNALELNRAKQDNATDRERIELLDEEIGLLLQRQKLINEQKAEYSKEANELKKQLADKGVKFDDDGGITNYKALVKSLEDKANGLVGDAQSEAVQDAKDLLDLIDKYVTLTEDTIPDLEIEWEKYTSQIKDSQDAIEGIIRGFKESVVSVQKDIADAYEHYQNKRYNKLQEALKKEKDAYNKAYEEEDFDRDLAKQQRELEEIAQQIAIYSRDTSEAGKARLEQLRKEYEEQQQAINDLIRDKEKDNANDRFDEVSESLNKELEDLLAPEKLVQVVNDAISSGMITIGEETMHINELMTDWLNETGDGLYALGDVLQTELLDNLREAQKIIGEMSINGFGRPSSINIPTSNALIQGAIDNLKGARSGDINFSLVVEGDVTKDSMPELEKQLNIMEKRIYSNIAKSMK